MRLDRLMTLGVVDPVRRALSRPPGAPARARELPILMYHGISETAETDVAPYYRTGTTPKRFAEQMSWLSESGWQGVTLGGGLEFLAGKRSFAGRPVALTFDDGFRDFYTDAVPSLRRHGFSATMYLPTAFVGVQGKAFKSRECLNWEEVRQLHGSGIEFGSHTVSHPVLYDISWDEIERELAHSKKRLEEELGQAIASFAYPYAFPQADRRFAVSLTELLKRLGYHNCVTTIVGRAKGEDDPFSLKRLPMNQCDDQPFLAAKLAGSYDWLAGPQKALKALKRTGGLLSGRRA